MAISRRSSIDVVVPHTLLMPFRFDAHALAADVAGVGEDEWQPHFNQGYYEGDWSGVALRSTGHRVALFSDPTAGPAAFKDTELLARCPNVKRALSAFECPLMSVRFLRLGPGSRIVEHRDYQIGLDEGEVRMHVPILSGPSVDFILGGEEVRMAPGECWYLDVTQMHQVTNRGTATRVHLVVDCVVNDWLLELLVATARAQT
jgi:hypothetical protein